MICVTMFARSMNVTVIQMSKAMNLSEVITGMIEELDLVSVVRCENCRRRDDKWEDWEEGKVYWCDIMDGCVKADDYCSYAERRVSDSDDE